MLTVILPARDAEGVIVEQLEALRNQRASCDWELVVVDHRSTDRTGELAESLLGHLPHVRIVRLNEGDNLAFARNRGVEHARGRAVAFCDADDVIQAHWVQAMAEALERFPLVVGKLDYVTLNSPSDRHRSAMQADHLERFFGAPNVFGASFGCERWVWDAIGGSDETLDKGEDTDFGIRAFLELGLEPHFVAEAVTAYRHRRGLRGNWRQGVGYGEVQPRLCKMYAHRLPIKPRRIRLAVARYLRILHALLRFHREEGRNAAAYRLGSAYGRLRGSLRQRYLYL